LLSSETSRAPLGDDAFGRAIEHRHQDLRDVDLRARASSDAALLDQLIDLGIGDPDPAHDLALAHPLDHDLVANVLAELGEGHAFLTQPLAQLGQRHLVLGRHVEDGPVDLGVVDARARLARIGDHHPLVDQGFEHLLAQRRERRQGRLVAGRLVTQARHPLLHLARGDQLLVDDGNDVVAGLGEKVRGSKAEGPRRDDAPAKEFQVSHRE
jgi:hypothetical protein